jgi:hypothetical protein
MTKLTWFFTILAVPVGSLCMNAANTLAEGVVYAGLAGIAIGLVNLGIHELRSKRGH